MLALTWFALSWLGYVWYSDYHRAQQPALRRLTDRFVRDWMARMVERDNRMLDVNVMRTLTRSSQFFASTTMLILGALVALMGYAEKAAGVLAELPFTQQVSERVWELKILLLVLIFVYAFFKFSWSIRQFGLGSILVGATQKAAGGCRAVRNAHRSHRPHRQLRQRQLQQRAARLLFRRCRAVVVSAPGTDDRDDEQRRLRFASARISARARCRRCSMLRLRFKMRDT